MGGRSADRSGGIQGREVSEMRWKTLPEWRPWFAWYPVQLQAADIWVWLEWVERKLAEPIPLGFAKNFYRLPANNNAANNAPKTVSRARKRLIIRHFVP